MIELNVGFTIFEHHLQQRNDAQTFQWGTSSTENCFTSCLSRETPAALGAASMFHRTAGALCLCAQLKCVSSGRMEMQRETNSRTHIFF